MIYNNILETIGRTPVVRINQMAPAGVDMYVKVEAFNPMASVKDRLAIGIIEDAERKGLLKPGQTVIEATSGNTGIALAMEGQTRPHFFTGVATIVLKLFTHIPANFAIFGEKDYQQLAVIRQMVRDLDLNITILAQPTIRETDGLALSSRNHYLSVADRKLAPRLYAEMQETAIHITKGMPVDAALANAKTRLTKAGFGKIDYFDLRHSDSLEPAESQAPNCRIFAAIWFGKTRLIDNYAL